MSKGLSKMPEPTTMDMIIQELVRRANQTNNRLRLIEQRMQAIESRVGSAEQFSFDQASKSKEKFTDLTNKLKVIDDRLAKIDVSLEKIFVKLDKTATKKELGEMESMFDLLSPIGQDFVTRKELDRKLGMG